jgi:hypothetical protein
VFFGGKVRNIGEIGGDRRDEVGPRPDQAEMKSGTQDGWRWGKGGFRIGKNGAGMSPGAFREAEAKARLKTAANTHLTSDSLDKSSTPCNSRGGGVHRNIFEVGICDALRAIWEKVDGDVKWKGRRGQVLWSEGLQGVRVLELWMSLGADSRVELHKGEGWEEGCELILNINLAMASDQMET